MRFMLILIFILSQLCFAIESNTYVPDQINGVWLTDAKDAKVQVYRVGSIYYGKIIWLKNNTNPEGKPLLDNYHPNPKFRNRTRVNVVALSGLTFQGDNKFENGILYYPTNGQTYRCSATLLNHNELELRIYFGVKLLGKTTVFTRVS